MSKSSSFQFLPLGAIIQSFEIDGINIVQGFPTQELYESHNSPYFGENIGRVANRIKNGKIDNLNGKSYQLDTNNGPNALHGGYKGWGKKIWKGPTPIGTKSIEDVKDLKGGESVKFTLTSEDGDQGYPGTVEATITYTTGTESLEEGKEEVQVLDIEYQVELVSGAEETVVNTTNHSYFNLSGEPTIAGTEVSLCTELYLPLDAGGIPTSIKPEAYPEIVQNQPFTLGPTSPDIDDCFTLPHPSPGSIPIDTRSLPLTRLVSAHHPKSNIHLEVHSTEPAFQFYTGKYIDVPAVKAADGEEVKARGARSAFCVEPSRYVNAVNVPEWREMVVLKKGEVYGSRIVYKGWSGK